MNDRKQKLAAIDAALSDMFRGLEARGVPEHLLRVVEQLEASELSAPEPKTAANEAVRRSPSRTSIQEP